MDRQTFLDLIPAYALGALDAAERSAFEAQLANDAEARQMLAEYQAITDLLVLTTPAQPAPAHLKQDLQRRLAARRAATPASQAPVSPTPEMRALPRSRPVLRLLALAAMLAAILGIVWYLTQRPAPGLSGRDRYDVLAAQEGALRVALAPADDLPQVSGDLVAAPDGREAVIRVSGLPALTTDQTFQLWRVDANSQVSSGGLFRADADPEATYIVISLDSPFRDYRAFGVSIEPAGGSPFADRPTGPRVFAISLAA